MKSVSLILGSSLALTTIVAAFAPTAVAECDPVNGVVCATVSGGCNAFFIVAGQQFCDFDFSGSHGSIGTMSGTLVAEDIPDQCAGINSCQTDVSGTIAGNCAAATATT